MLGDAGSNFFGVITGFGFSRWGNVTGKIILCSFLLLLTFISEKYSFSKYIEKNSFFHWIDKLGQK